MHCRITYEFFCELPGQNIKRRPDGLYKDYNIEHNEKHIIDKWTEKERDEIHKMAMKMENSSIYKRVVGETTSRVGQPRHIRTQSNDPQKYLDGIKKKPQYFSNFLKK